MRRIYDCYAKINLFLAIGEPRADGYHAIDTVMQSVDLADRLTCETTAGSGIEVRCHAPGVPSGPANLVWRALDRLQREAGVTMGMRVDLAKRIPPQAGLGGGSSDAAGALAAGNQLWGLDWPEERLETIAAGIGSDVPFFIRGGTQRCTGRGERVRRLAALPRSAWIIVKPPWGLRTASVYAEVKPRLTSYQAQLRMVLEHIAKRDLAGVLSGMFNDLESAAQTAHPGTGEVKARLHDLGLANLVLAGSGSAWVGHAPHGRLARGVRAAAAARGWQVFQVQSVRRGWIEAQR